MQVIKDSGKVNTLSNIRKKSHPLFHQQLLAQKQASPRSNQGLDVNSEGVLHIGTLPTSLHLR